MNRIFAFTSTLTCIALAVSVSSSAQAQIAEVPAANAKGDFTTARVLGNRGYYSNTRWLIVDASGSLNCRATPNGAVRKTLDTGWVVTAAASSKNGDAVVLHQGSPWLRVLPQDPLGGESNQPACFIRANNRYIAPISEDFVRQGIGRTQ